MTITAPNITAPNITAPNNIAQTSDKTKPIGAIVIGGSAGSIDALSKIIPSLPRLEIPVVIVLHLPPRGPSILHEAFVPSHAQLIKQAEDKEPLASNVIYCAPPGYHLLIEADHSFALSMDDPVLFSRPSIDVLFESACDAYDGRVLGILLSGANGDGAEGLHDIHRAGGITIVQSPDSAEATAMPHAALALFTPTYTLAPHEIATLIAAFSRRESIQP